MTSNYVFAGDIMESSCFIRKIRQEEIEKALLLVWQVFQEYEAPDYTQVNCTPFVRQCDIMSNKWGAVHLCIIGGFVFLKYLPNEK